MPSWAVGRTAREVLVQNVAMADQLSKFNQAPAPVQVPVQQDRFDYDIADDDFVSGKQVKQIVQRFQNQGAPVDPVARSLAASGNVMTIQREEADSFRRWGPELQAEIAKVPQELRTIDNLKLVVDIVKGRHVQELVDEQARQKAAQLTQEQVATIRSGTGGSAATPNTPIDLRSDDLPAEWRAKAEKHGLTIEQIREFCQSTGDTVEQYFETVKKYGKGAVIHG